MKNLGIRPSLAEVGAGYWHVEGECLEPGLRMTGRFRGTREEGIRHGPTGADEEVKEVIGPVVRLSSWCHRRKEDLSGLAEDAKRSPRTEDPFGCWPWC